MKKYFAIHTKIKPNNSLKQYLELVMNKQSSLYRIAFRAFQNNSKLTCLQLRDEFVKKYNIDKRDAYSIIKDAHTKLKMHNQYSVTIRDSLFKRSNKLKNIINSNSLQLENYKCIKNFNTLSINEHNDYKDLKRTLYFQRLRLNKINQEIATLNKNIKNECIPFTFGGSKLFKSQYQNNDQSHEQWLNNYRLKINSEINSIGSPKDFRGNLNFQLYYIEKYDDFTLKIKVDKEFYSNVNADYIYLRHLKFNHLQKELIKSINQRKSPFTFKIKRRGNDWYLIIMFAIEKPDPEGNTKNGVVGLDFNYGFINLSETDNYGNLIKTKKISLPHKGEKNKSENELKQHISHVVKYAKTIQKPIVIENIDLYNRNLELFKTRNKSLKKLNKTLSSLDYANYKESFESACFRNDVKLIKINPAYTSQIGKTKYAGTKKLNTHQAASFVIARRGQGYFDQTSIMN